VEHDITTATTGVDRDRPPAVGVVGEADADVRPAGTSSHEDAEAQARPSPAYVSVPPDVWALARGIAAVLGETMPPPIRTITRAVDRIGPDRMRAVLGQALTVEAQGGLTLHDGRRRTPGGVFFPLVRASDEIKGRGVEFSPALALRPLNGRVAVLSVCGCVRYGDREQGIGRLCVGILRHAGALARRRLVVTLDTNGRAAGCFARFFYKQESLGLRTIRRPGLSYAPKRGDNTLSPTRWAVVAVAQLLPYIPHMGIADSTGLWLSSCVVGADA